MTADPDDLDVIDFDAARREETDKPIRFQLGGERFTALALMPAMAFLEQQGQEVALMDFMRAVLPDGEYDRFVAVVARKDDPIDVVHVLRVVKKLEAMYAARPTLRPTDSLAGPATTGDESNSEPEHAASVTPLASVSG